MKDFLDKAPFVRLLIALLLGIFLQYYFDIAGYAFFVVLIGFLFLLFSFFLSPSYRYLLRSFFGIGIFLLVCGIGIFRVEDKENQMAYSFSKGYNSHIGTIKDIPQAKPRSIACNILLEDHGSHEIVCYFQIDSMSRTLSVGDRILFYAEIKPFKNRGNPDDFDYASYMKHLGFSGAAYVGGSRWEKLDGHHSSLYIYSQQLRKHVLDFYRTLHIGDNNFAVFAALTLGYVNELDDSVQQMFRATGTSHILSVSGLHVAILYMAIAFILNFLPTNRRTIVIRQIVIILMLWAYAFLTGLPPSVVRATLMISVFCVATALRRKAFSYNTVCFSAFAMLLYNPFDFFHIGFQLSFAAVLSICFFLPHILSFYRPKNKILKFLWEILAVSLAVQLGSYPICIYYFGTFPTYFFITNLVIVPLSTLVMYSSLCVFLTTAISGFFSAHSHEILFLPLWILKNLLTCLLASASFFESLPSSLIKDISISLPQAFCLIFLSIFVVLFLRHRDSKTLMLTLGCISIYLLIGLPVFAKEKDSSLYIFNRNDKLEIGTVEDKKFVIDTAHHSPLVLSKIAEKKVAIVRSDAWLGMRSDNRFPVDYLVLTGKDSLSIYHLNKLFNTKMVIIDGVFPARFSRRVQRECKKLNIECYDVKEKGAFRIKKY